jgi:hypothetical protein
MEFSICPLRQFPNSSEVCSVCGNRLNVAVFRSSDGTTRPASEALSSCGRRCLNSVPEPATRSLAVLETSTSPGATSAARVPLCVYRDACDLSSNELAVSCMKSGAGLQPEFVHRVSGAGHPGRPFARGPCRRATPARRGWFLEKAAMERQVTVKFGHTRSKRFQKALSEAGNGPGECGRARVGQDYRVSSPVARRRLYTPSSPPARTGSPLRATHVPAKLTVLASRRTR